MDFDLSDYREFREEIGTFLSREVTVGLVSEAESGQGWGYRAWEFVRKLGAKRWLAPSWPEVYGGLSLTPLHRLIVREELDYSGALPEGASMIGVDIVGPILMLHGNDGQRRRYLTRIANGEIEFALGYTEPEAGSDLANIRLTATEENEHYVLNGQKIFSTRAHFAQYHWLAARTGTGRSRHWGLSLFIVDLRSPGIEVQPLWTLGGTRTNHVFYDNVSVPKENLVGEKHRGFYHMLTALDLERIFPVGGLKRTLDRLVQYAKDHSRLRQDPVVRQRLASLATDVEVARLLAYRLAWLQGNRALLSYQAAELKLFVSELWQKVVELAMDSLGMVGQLQTSSGIAPLGGTMERLCRESPVYSVAGGTSEVMRNIMAVRGLGLPRGGE